MPTKGINHLGLTVRNLDETTAFFLEALGWKLIARDDSYPRATVTDGHTRFTLWQVSESKAVTEFDRKTNIGLHHVALEVSSREDLQSLADRIRSYPGTAIEFEPEPLAGGPRMHMMFTEPGGIRMEIIWPAA